jgi:hypothetical protein
MNTKLIITILFISILAVACKKSDDDSSTPSNAAVTYNDGADVTVDSINAVLYTLGVPPFNREIDVYAYKGGDQVLEFHFLPKTGAQNVSQSFSDAWLTYLINDGATYPDDYFNCTSGNFNLTDCDTVGNIIKGTFDFVATNGTTSKTISSGKLNITTLVKQ